MGAPEGVRDEAFTLQILALGVLRIPKQRLSGIFQKESWGIRRKEASGGDAFCSVTAVGRLRV